MRSVSLASADTEDAAHHRDRVLGPLRLDEPEDHLRVRSVSCAKKAAAFPKISRLGQDLDLAPQPLELLTLGRGKAFGLALVDIKLGRPASQRAL